MAMKSLLLHLPKTHFPSTLPKPQPTHSLSSPNCDPKSMVGLIGAGLTLTVMAPASAADQLPLLDSLQLSEPANALSLPTWAIHVSSLVEWITAMVLVWQYGSPSWWSFLCVHLAFLLQLRVSEVLVALQAALTVIGNATMCFAAYRIYRSTEERSKKL